MKKSMEERNQWRKKTIGRGNPQKENFNSGRKLIGKKLKNQDRKKIDKQNQLRNKIDTERNSINKWTK